MNRTALQASAQAAANTSVVFLLPQQFRNVASQQSAIADVAVWYAEFTACVLMLDVSAVLVLHLFRSIEYDCGVDNYFALIVHPS